jgi:hypothetical protein
MGEVVQASLSGFFSPAGLPLRVSPFYDIFISKRPIVQMVAAIGPPLASMQHMG